MKERRSTHQCPRDTREQEFEQWVTNMIPKMLALDDLEAKYRPFYICGVVRRFAFFLCKYPEGSSIPFPSFSNQKTDEWADGCCIARLNIDDVLLSPLLTDFLELKDYEIIGDQNHLNPFSLNYTKRIYGTSFVLPE